MHQSIPPVPMPPSNPGAFFKFSVLGLGHLYTPGWPLGIWYTWRKNRQKPGPSSRVFYFFAVEAFVEKDIDFELQWLVREGLDKLVEIFRGEFSKFRKFSSVL